MNLRLASGSVTPGEPAEEVVRSRPHGPAGCCSCCGTARRPAPPRPARIRPWSTNTQVSWSPIASWISTAATALSTPPDRPQITLPVADLLADVGDLGVAEARPSSSRRRSRRRGATKLASSLPPSGVCTTSGWNIRRVEAARPRRWRSRRARLRTWRRSLKPSGKLLDPVAVAHPHLVLLADLPQPVEQRAVVDDLDEGAAELAIVGRARPCRPAAGPWSAGRSRCRGSAGRASKKCCGARGLSSHITDDGPPDRMMPLGFSRSNASSAALNGAISQ